MKHVKKRCLVAMSGGVDSSVAAALLKKEGWDVTGVTMCFGIKGGGGSHPSCCGATAIEDARSVAHQLGIRHYVLSMAGVLKRDVIADFSREYLRGRTPNPCVRCNKYVKFGSLLAKAKGLGVGYLATGHYVRLRRRGGHVTLLKAKDERKDQSYFLYRLGRAELSRAIFPVGGLLKEEVRAIASSLGLPVAHKKDSQEVCFIPGDDYRAFLGALGSSRLKKVLRPGDILDRTGRVLGRHKGCAFYTIGQRRGLGIAAAYPLYVVSIDAAANTVTVGAKADAYGRVFLVKDPHFIGAAPKKAVAAEVKIRYNHTQAAARIFPGRNELTVAFDVAQFAITPGQSAVFYDGALCRGGGIIDKVAE